MAEMTGVVTIVQEGRFQLTDDDGVSHLFILGPLATTETAQLRPLAKAQTRVKVRYEEAKKVIGLVARSIDVCEPVAT